MKSSGHPAGKAEPPPLEGEERPPFLGSWRNLYLLVAAGLGLVVALCGWITSHNR